MRRTVIQTEPRFVLELTKLVHDYQGRLKPGVRTFWLMAAALAALDLERPSRADLFAFEWAARRVYTEVRRYV